MTTQTAPFDAADYLNNDETIAEFLTASMEDPNPAVFLMARHDVAKARGWLARPKSAAGAGTPEQDPAAPTQSPEPSPHARHEPGRNTNK